MKKKKLNILVAVFVSLAMVAISVMGIVSELFNPHIEYEVNLLGGTKIGTKDIFRLIHTQKELYAYVGDAYHFQYDKDLLIDTYTEAYFEEKSIILWNIYTPNSRYKYSIKDVYIKNKVLIVDIELLLYKFGNDIAGNKTYLISVNKSDISDITGISKKITEVEAKEDD